MSKKHISSFAVFEPNEQGGYNVSFPSFPGCVTFGKTFEEAQIMAKEVLTLWVQEMKAHKKSFSHYSGRPIIDHIEIPLGA